MKRVSFILFFVFFGSVVLAQEGKETYFTIKSGFTFPVAQSTVGSPRDEVGQSILNINGDSYSEKNPFGSRGAGGTFAASFGHMFMQNFGLEIEFSFIRTRSILDASQDRTDSDGNRYFAEQHSYTNMFRATPMLVVMGNESMKVRPYAKFGVLIPLAGKTVAEVTMEDNTGELADLLLPVIAPDDYDIIQNFLEANPVDIPIPTYGNITAKTGAVFSVGFAARFGAEISINDRLGLFGEMEMNMLTIKAKETEFTEFEAGVPDGFKPVAESLGVKDTYGLDDIPEILRVTVYQDEITEESNSSLDRNGSTYNRDAAYEQLTFRDNYNSFGFMFGVRYAFGKKSSPKNDGEFRVYQ